MENPKQWNPLMSVTNANDYDECSSITCKTKYHVIIEWTEFYSSIIYWSKFHVKSELSCITVQT